MLLKTAKNTRKSAPRLYMSRWVFTSASPVRPSISRLFLRNQRAAITKVAR
jgi:hypothetical protein